MANGYPDNLPAYTPPPAPPAAKPDPVSAPQSTYDTLKNRGRDIMSRVDAAVRGTANPDNNLPDNSFHKPGSR
jgi:hypothetical protein